MLILTVQLTFVSSRGKGQVGMIKEIFKTRWSNCEKDLNWSFVGTKAVKYVVDDVYLQI